MDTQDELSIAKSIRTINHELAELWKSMARQETNMEWIKNILWRGVVPLMAGIAVLVLSILLKLLLT